MTQSPQHSLPQQCGSWAGVKAAYRLLSNPDVNPHAIQQPHRQHTLGACDAHRVVLCIQDTTELDLSRQKTMRGRGRLGNTTTQGLLQHTALACVPAAGDIPLDQPAGELLGVLHQCWHRRTQAVEGETLRQLQSRRTDADVWLETASAVDHLGSTPARLIHVGDRHCDLFRFFAHTHRLGHGFVVRAMHDRLLVSTTSSGVEPRRLWETMQARPIACEVALTIHEQRTKQGQVRRVPRQVTLAIRYHTITLPPPQNDIRTKNATPMTAHAVYVCEQDAPADTDAVSWMLITSEPVRNTREAMQIVRYYRHRWVIEEWHRVLKEGCRVEATHFDDAADVQRLAAIKGVIAVRLLQLRDLADQAGDDPRALQRAVPGVWITVAAALAREDPATLTPQQFWRTLAKQGGYLARKRDPRPGWKVLWRGWYDIQQMVRGAQLVGNQSCG